MKMRQFHIFSKNMCIRLKSSNIEDNLGRSASYLISVDENIVLINLYYKKYIVTIR